MGLTELLLETRLDRRQREYLELVSVSSGQLLHTINNLLDFAAIESGRAEPEIDTFDVHECVESALELVAAKAAEKQLEVTWRRVDDHPRRVRGDAAKIRQVLLHLLSNAVRLTPEGKVEITVGGSALGDGRHALRFSVRDRGPGLTPERLLQILQMSSRNGPGTRLPPLGQSGFGLTISQRLIELMGGELSVEAAPGGGSVLTFTAVVTPDAEADDRGSCPESCRAHRLLIIDDNPVNRLVLGHQVSREGFAYSATSSPGQALQWLREGRSFDLVLCDYLMPEMDGLQWARACHDLKPDLPVIIVSSVGGLPMTDSPVRGVLTKPVPATQLLERIRSEISAASDRACGTAHEEPEPRVTPSIKILIAEDLPVNRKVACALLKRLGHRADVATDGKAVLEALTGMPYDVVLMDVQMPGMDGLTATREIRKRMPKDRQPRIIGVTANATDEDRRACLAAGMDDFLAKPITPAQLARALARCPRLPPSGAAEEDEAAA